jgi:hypothetical protein
MAGMTFRATPVGARMVKEVGVTAAITPIDMGAECTVSAVEDIEECPFMRLRHAVCEFF